MTIETSRDLGHGVRVMPGEGGGLVVLSERLDLGWRPGEGGRPGSAVMVDGASFEVVDRQPWRVGGRWILEEWSRDDVMRVVATLDTASVARLAADRSEDARAAGLRPWMWLFAPVLGFAVAPWQRRWRDRWGFPAAGATISSALAGLLFGAACLIETMVRIGAGGAVFPWIPRPLLFVGLYLFGEGLVRLAQVFSDSEPVGSLLGLVISAFERSKPTPRPPLQSPEVTAGDGEDGRLELRSTIQRRDWEQPGLLPYRGEHFALESTRRLGEDWVYLFARVEVAGDGGWRTLHLAPPRSEPFRRSFEEEPGLVATVLFSIASAVAPAEFQRRWAWRTGARATVFTIFGAAVELIGGVANLGTAEGAHGIALAVNLFFVAEGLVRLGRVVFRGEPMGSVLGLPLGPLTDRLLPEG